MTRARISDLTASEAQIQAAVCEWLAWEERAGRLAYYAVPNGGSRHPGEARNLKRTGVRRGIPDLVILLPLGQSLYVEMKSASGRLSSDQKSWHTVLRRMGFGVAVCRSVDDVQAAVDRFLIRSAA